MRTSRRLLLVAAILLAGSAAAAPSVAAGPVDDSDPDFATVDASSGPSGVLDVRVGSSAGVHASVDEVIDFVTDPDKDEGDADKGQEKDKDEGDADKGQEKDKDEGDADKGQKKDKDEGDADKGQKKDKNDQADDEDETDSGSDGDGSSTKGGDGTSADTAGSESETTNADEATTESAGNDGNDGNRDSGAGSEEDRNDDDDDNGGADYTVDDRELDVTGGEEAGINWSAIDGVVETDWRDDNEILDTEESGTVKVVDASVPADWVRAGHTTTVMATVANTGRGPATGILTVTVDGEPVATEHVRLTSERAEVAIEFPAVEGAVAVEGVAAGTIAVRDDGTASRSTPTEGNGDGFGLRLFALLFTTVALVERAIRAGRR